MSKARTAHELREDFLRHLHCLVREWDTVDGKSSRERLDGLVFSVLTAIDGCSAGLCAMDVVMRPHPDDKRYCLDNDEDWVEDGTVLNSDVMLHDLWYK